MSTQPANRNFHAPERDAIDTALLARLNQSDPVAFRAIFDHYATPLVLYAGSLLEGVLAPAEDIVQDLFTYLWTHRHTLKVTGGLRTYLYGAVRNRCWSVLRHEGVRRAMERRIDPQAGVAPAHQRPDRELAGSELGAAIEQALSGLSKRQREIWRLNRDDGMSYAEVAELLGLSVKTVETHMGRTLKELRLRLAEWR
jgi:RNA polymerase sigma-70 factor (ECF subfamily)